MSPEILKLKNLLKKAASELWSLKKSVKEKQKENDAEAPKFQYQLYKYKKSYRHHHIAYSLLRGRAYEEVEKPRKDNEPDMDLIRRIINEYKSEDVCVRNDLSDTYKGVQGGHALAQFALEHSELFKSWKNGHLIYLNAHNLKSLRKWADKLSFMDIPISIFKEPDLDNQETSLACYDGGEIFKDLKIT